MLSALCFIYSFSLILLPAVSKHTIVMQNSTIILLKQSCLSLLLCSFPLPLIPSSMDDLSSDSVERTDRLGHNPPCLRREGGHWLAVWVFAYTTVMTGLGNKRIF